jgi:ABC-2 type transport system ATP-binding protein
MIEVKNISKNYNQNNALKNINFNIKTGEIVGLIGQNGAGKTTIMNIITGFISATEGSVLINGLDIVHQSQLAKKCIGYLPENPPLYLDMNVDEYLSFVCDIKGVKKALKNEMTLELKKMFKLEDVSKRLIKNLSKGYKQRVGIAGAMVGFPKVLILDEPTAGLDPRQVIELRGIIKKLGEKSTIILSSHILSELSCVCSRVIILNKGVVVANEEICKKNKNNHGTKVLVRLKCNEQLVKNIFKKNKQITIESINKSEETDMYDIIIKSIKEEDIREDIAKAVLENGLTIYTMKSLEITLEDIFIKNILGQGDTI